MAYELRDMSGSLFRNSNKKSDNHPDYSGTVMINGVEMFINGWLKEGNNGKFFSLAFKPKDGTKQSSNPSKSFHDDLNDELPPF